MYGPGDSLSATANQNDNKQEKWPLIEYIQSLLEGKGADQKIEVLRDAFSDYNPLFDGDSKQDRSQKHDVHYA